MKKIAIIGASYLQEPLIEKAKSMGIETHVFAWKANDVGERSADHFYPISIIEKENILDKCREIGIDGICSIASDLAVITVNYVAEMMHLPGNPDSSTIRCTNKHYMRECFKANGDPSPKSMMVHSAEDLKDIAIQFPIIVKPVDRSGSRGIMKLYSEEKLSDAISCAENQGFIKNALVEEFATGQEYSVECISYQGKHNFLAMTKKFTTGAPNFIETGHIEPAPVDDRTLEKVKSTIFHALNSLGVMNGASHSELKIDSNGNLKIIEIGARMGGDFIGSTLVHISTGIDFVKDVVQVALGCEPDLKPDREKKTAGVRFIFSEKDVEVYHKLQSEHPEYIYDHSISDNITGTVTDSSTRFGYFIMCTDTAEEMIPYLPTSEEDT